VFLFLSGCSTNAASRHSRKFYDNLKSRLSLGSGIRDSSESFVVGLVVVLLRFFL